MKLKISFKSNLIPMIITFFLSSCSSKKKESVIKHIIPNNYEGVIFWVVKKDSPVARQTKDTIFVEYNDKGYFESGDLSTSFDNKTEHFYQNGEKISFIKDTTYGSFRGGGYFSNIVTKKVGLNIDIKARQDSIIQKLLIYAGK